LLILSDVIGDDTLIPNILGIFSCIKHKERDASNIRDENRSPHDVSKSIWISKDIIFVSKNTKEVSKQASTCGADEHKDRNCKSLALRIDEFVDLCVTRPKEHLRKEIFEVVSQHLPPEPSFDEERKHDADGRKERSESRQPSFDLRNVSLILVADVPSQKFTGHAPEQQNEEVSLCILVVVVGVHV